MQKTLQQLITGTERRLYQMAGPGVQLYAQSVLEQKLNDAFTFCFGAKFWPQFVVREQRTLDGITGKTTVPFTNIRSWDDVLKGGVFRRNSPNPIPTLPLSFNTIGLTGSSVRYIEPSSDATLFTAYPLDAVDDIVVVGRARPVAGDFVLTDVVPFDSVALELYAAWDYCVDDASNAAQAQKFQAQFDARMKMLEEAAFDNRVPLNPRAESIPTNWYTS